MRARMFTVMPKFVGGLAISLGAALAALAPAVSSAAAEGPNDLVVYGPPTYVESMSGQPEDVQLLARQAAALADAHKGEFLGSYVAEGGHVVVVPATQVGRTLALTDLPDARSDVGSPVGISITSAQDLGGELIAQSPELTKTAYMWGADPKRRGIFISLAAEPSAGARALVEDFASKRSVPIAVEIDPGAQPGQT